METKMADQETSSLTPISTVDPYKYLQFTKNPDGTITRHYEFPSTPPSSDPANPSPTVTKDVPLNPNKKTRIRLYLPKATLTGPSTSKLPIIVYYHGGGFVVLRMDSIFHQHFCSGVAAEAGALLVSVDYRLAPESRLPAAYDDCMEAFDWIKGKGGKQDEWVQKYGDFSRCFLMGSSAGGNIAYHLGLRAGIQVNGLEPLNIKGWILHQPFFGGAKRTKSELRLLNDPILPLSGTDLMWELGLPVGSDRDHEYCNPVVGGGVGLDRIKELGWQVLVAVCGGDPLIDRILEFIRLLEGKDIRVTTNLSDDGSHGAEFMDLAKAEALFVAVRKFIESCF